MLRIDIVIRRVGDMHSENAWSTQLFLYWSGERSVNCVRLALEASKEEQRDVVRFLVAEGTATRYKVKTPWNAVRRNHPFP